MSRTLVMPASTLSSASSWPRCPCISYMPAISVPPAASMATSPGVAGLSTASTAAICLPLTSTLTRRRQRTRLRIEQPHIADARRRAVVVRDFLLDRGEALGAPSGGELAQAHFFAFVTCAHDDHIPARPTRTGRPWRRATSCRDPCWMPERSYRVTCSAPPAPCTSKLSPFVELQRSARQCSASSCPAARATPARRSAATRGCRSARRR